MLWISSNTSRAFAPKFSGSKPPSKKTSAVSAMARGCSWIFFLHEVAVWAQLQRSQRQFGYFNRAFGLRTGFVEQFFDAVCVQQGDVAVFQVGECGG